MSEIAFEQTPFVPPDRQILLLGGACRAAAAPKSADFPRATPARSSTKRKFLNDVFSHDPYSCEHPGQSGETPKASELQCSAAPLMILRRRSGIGAARSTRLRIVGLLCGRRLKHRGIRRSGRKNASRMKKSSRNTCMPAANSSPANSIGERIENNRPSGSCL